ncbi:MAG: SLBB domain-containing protein [Candidatus Marinimicrobia bacterium]|nr:SLBB domain-containing protein [Candidatus Neomarinimicrobiota bacterium]
MKSSKEYRRALWLALFLVIVGAWIVTPARAAFPADDGTDALRAGDELLITIPGPASGQATYIIDFNGYLHLPVVGIVKCEGTTLPELEQAITDRLPDYLKGSTAVKAEILTANYFIRLSGHVAAPGWYRVPLHFDIEQAIGLAGGAADGAVMSEIKILRSDSSGVTEIPVDYFRYKSTGDQSLLPGLRQKDTVFIPQSARFGDVKRSLGSWFPPKSDLEITIADQIRVIGEVRRPQFIEPIPGANVLDLISLAGGPNGAADLRRVVLFRNIEGTQTRRVVNIYALLQTGQLDQIDQTMAGDVIYVPAGGRSFAARSWKRFRENASTISTLVFMASALNQLYGGR